MNMKKSWTNQVIDAVDINLGNFNFGKSPVLDLDQLIERLSHLFPDADFNITIKSADYYHADQILKFAGANPTVISLELAPIAHPFFISIPAEDIQIFSGMLISKDLKSTFHENELLKGFFKFFFLEVMKLFKTLNLYDGLSLRFSEETFKPQDSYCLEIAISLNQITSYVRVIIPLEFQKHFQEFYNSRKIPLKDRINFSQVNLPLSLSLGHVSLKKSQLDSLKIGDLLLLDTASYQPKSKKGYFKLSFNQLPLFQVKIKEDQLKILDFITSGDEYHMDEMEDESFIEESISDNESEQLIDPSKINLTIICEVGKFEMNLDDLLQLKAGSTVAFSKRPEEGVYLTLNQKKIAKGEVIQLGDAIGVKILETY